MVSLHKCKVGRVRLTTFVVQPCASVNVVENFPLFFEDLQPALFDTIRTHLVVFMTCAFAWNVRPGSCRTLHNRNALGIVLVIRYLIGQIAERMLQQG